MRIYHCAIIVLVFLFSITSTSQGQMRKGSQLQLTEPVPVAPGKFLTRQMPDLVIEKYDEQRNVLVVVNRGNADAVFPVAAPLVSYGDQQVPAGGKISMGQRVEVRITEPFACPDSIYSDWQYLVGRQWTYNLPQPVDGEGRKLVLVDPNGIVREASENNNAFLIKQANRFKPVESPEQPNLQVVSLVLSERDGSQGKRLLDWHYKVQNIGPGYAFICEEPRYSGEVWIAHKVANVKIDGQAMPQNKTFVKSPWIFKTGEIKEIWDFTELSIQDQFGTMSQGLQAGCHEITVTVDPQELIQETNECDNMTTTYYATGGATCPTDKAGVVKVSNCSNYPVRIRTPARKLTPERKFTPVPVPSTPYPVKR
jgi:hypothetical protein